jgi:NitT/TauT family transport system permease protein
VATDRGLLTALRQRARSGRATAEGRRAGRAPWWRRWVFPAASIAAFLIAWQLAAVAYRHASPLTSPSRLPVPLTIASTLAHSGSGFAAATGSTARGAITGLLAGVVIAVLLSVLAVSMRWLEDTIYPYLVASQMVPTIVLAPIVLAVVKNGTVARVIVAAYISFFVIVVNMTKGLKSIHPDQQILLRSLRARPWQYYTKLRLPACLPFFFAGLKVAAPLSVVGEIVVELTGSTSGLGYLILSTQYYGPRYVTLFWAAMVITLALGFAFYRAVAVIERRVSPWQHEFRTR